MNLSLGARPAASEQEEIPARQTADDAPAVVVVRALVEEEAILVDVRGLCLGLATAQQAAPLEVLGERSRIPFLEAVALDPVEGRRLLVEDAGHRGLATGDERLVEDQRLLAYDGGRPLDRGGGHR